MSMMASLMLTLSAAAPAALADFGSLSPPGRIRDGLPVRFTHDPPGLRPSPYMLPVVGTPEEAEPARFRIRGRKVKLRVPLGTGS